MANTPVKWLDWNEKSGLLWDDYESKHQHKYWPLEDMDDFIAQVNWVGQWFEKHKYENGDTHFICQAVEHINLVHKFTYWFKNSVAYNTP